MRLSLDQRLRILEVNGFQNNFLPKTIDYGYEVINKELYEACRAHCDKYKSDLTDKVLLMVHHEFASLDPNNYRYGKALTSYQDGLDSLVRIARDNEWSTALFTFPELYSHHKGLIEQGVYDAAFLTYFCRGKPYKEDLTELNDKSLFISGCYGGLCIDELISNLQLTGCSDIIVVPEAVLFSHKLRGVNSLSLSELKTY